MSIIVSGVINAQSVSMDKIPTLSQERIEHLMNQASKEVGGKSAIRVSQETIQVEDYITEDKQILSKYDLSKLLSKMEAKHNQETNLVEYVYISHSPTQMELSREDYEKIVESKDYRELVNKINNSSVHNKQPFVYNIIKQTPNAVFVLIGNKNLDKNPYELSNPLKAYRFLLSSDRAAFTESLLSLSRDDAIKFLSKVFNAQILSQDKKDLAFEKTKEHFKKDTEFYQYLTSLPAKPVAKDIDLLLDVMANSETATMSTIFESYRYSLVSKNLSPFLKSILDKRILDYIKSANEETNQKLDTASVVNSLTSPNISDINDLEEIYNINIKRDSLNTMAMKRATEN